MKRIVWLLVPIGIAVGLTVSQGDDERDAHVRTFMRQKLEHSKNILEGLALEKFDKIEKNAGQLTVLSQAASWRAMRTPEYARFSGEFSRLTEKLVRMARDKNIDGATLAYVELTINCVNCHKYVRGVKSASITGFDAIPALAGR